jgi:hypothetical protein
MTQTVGGGGALYMCERDSCSGFHLYPAAMKHERDTGHLMLRLDEFEAVEIRRMWRRQNRCWVCGGHDHDHEDCRP